VIFFLACPVTHQGPLIDAGGCLLRVLHHFFPSLYVDLRSFFGFGPSCALLGGRRACFFEVYAGSSLHSLRGESRDFGRLLKGFVDVIQLVD